MGNKTQKTAFIAIVGRANVGKSSFLNKAIGQKVAIVSNKPQTTRTRIMGALTKEDTQLIFIDTPGFHKPKNALGEQMIKAVQTGLSDVDAVMLMVEASPKFKFDAENLPKAEMALIDDIRKRNLKAILVINKVDLLEDKSELLSIISAYSKQYDFDAVIPVSVKDNDGIDAVIKSMTSYAVSSPHYFDELTITDQADSIIVCETIREKMLNLLDKEIPHGVAVLLERFYERDNKNGEPIIEIEGTVYCERESHKGIIIGKGGAMLKKIGTLSRADLEEFFGCKCNLKLWVKVKEDWRNREGLVQSIMMENKL